jgi:hypothetical protein
MGKKEEEEEEKTFRPGFPFVYLCVSLVGKLYEFP